MKKLMCLLVCAALSVSLVSCGAAEAKPSMEPKISQMKAICELAVMDCYYHNVAKFREENAEGVLFWQKDKHFWIEYSGVVSLGIDVSQVTVEVDDTLVTITIPEAEVLRCQVDSDKLSEDSYIVAKNSAKISAEDEVAAFAQAQADLEATAAADTRFFSARSSVPRRFWKNMWKTSARRWERTTPSSGSIWMVPAPPRSLRRTPRHLNRRIPLRPDNRICPDQERPSCDGRSSLFVSRMRPFPLFAKFASPVAGCDFHETLDCTRRAVLR